MKLRILVLQESEAAKIPEKATPFRWLTHHVSEIYMNLLPGININNSAKVTIEFGPQGDETAFDAMFGCTNVFIEDFDFDKFYALSTLERNMTLLDEIKKNLISIYRRKSGKNEDIQSIESTADIVVSTGFSLDIPIRKLQKITDDKKYKIEIHRILNAEVGEAWKCLVTNRKDSSLLMNKWITDVPDYLDRTDYFKQAEIKDDSYLLYNLSGHITFQMKISDIE